jgi:beta-1,4-N-acetylglucosaminyltransferase
MAIPNLSAPAKPSYVLPLLLIFLSVLVSLSILLAARLTTILLRPTPASLTPSRPQPSSSHPTHLLIVLGSGGHTAEMLNMLRRLPLLPMKYTHRTYVVSSGDAFSALKAKEFEREVSGTEITPGVNGFAELSHSYDIVTVRRARRVHQSLMSTPWSAALCLWECIKLLRGSHPDQGRLQRARSTPKPGCPDLILTNGPGTGVCVVLASLILLFFGLSRPSQVENDSERSRTQQQQYLYSGQMRTIFIESWARVKTLSLSGKILMPLVDRFLVQWPGLEGRGGGKAEFVGALVA